MNPPRQLARSGAGQLGELRPLTGAGVLGAIYHVVADESRSLINHTRLRRQYSRQRHELILVATLGTDLSIEVLQVSLVCSQPIQPRKSTFLGSRKPRLFFGLVLQ